MITFVHYHQIKDETFNKHLQFYKENYNICELSDLAHDVTLPPHPLFITFDDGWNDSYPILPTFQTIPHLVTIFLTVRFIDTWIHPRTKTKGDRHYTLTSQQIREMSPTVNFQSHGLTHRDITKLSHEEIRHELTESKHRIEKLTGSPVYAYAYPYNKANGKTTQALKECGYKMARMGERMLNKPDADLFTLKSVGVPEGASVLDVRYRLLKARVKTLLHDYDVY